MAKTKLAAPIAGIRGTLGGIVYSANGSGTYVKAWNPPSNPKTFKQMQQRAHLAQMPGLWNALTQVQRDAWDTFAALPAQELEDSLGQAYFVSGWLWFVKCNVRLLRVGRSPITATPTIPRPAAPSINFLHITPAGPDNDISTSQAGTASTQAPLHGPNLAYDGNQATFWQTLPPNTTGWIYFALGSPEPSTKMTIFVPAGAPPNTNPKDFHFDQWTGLAWVNFLTISNFQPPTPSVTTFHLPNPDSSTQYRLFVTANNGHASILTAYELTYFTGLEGNSFIAYPEDSFTTTPYDLILHIAMTDSKSKSVQYPGYYEILASQTPSRWSAPFQDELTNAFGTILPGRRWFARLFRQTTEGIRSAAATTAANTVS